MNAHYASALGETPQAVDDDVLGALGEAAADLDREDAQPNACAGESDQGKTELSR